jgi:uncharacterized repeat protein (TIGR01451 family)
VVISDTLPAEVTYGGVVSQPPGWTGPSVGAGPRTVLTWSRSVLTASVEGSIVYTVTVDAEFSGVLTNTVEISTTTVETRYDDNRDDEPTEVDPVTDVAITKVGEPNLVDQGDQLVYTLAYRNNGPGTAYNVVVSDTLPPEAEYVSALPAPVPPTTDRLWWELGTLTSGESGTIVVTTTVTTAAVDTFTNTVEISTTTPETNYRNNRDSDPTDVSTNVAITKTGSPNLVTPGDQLVYQLAYINDGPAVAENVVVSDTLPPEVTFVSADPIPTSQIGQRLRWELGSLGAGIAGTIVVTVNVTAEARDTFVNPVEISTTTPERTLVDNRDEWPTDVALTDLMIEKSVDHRTAEPGQELEYELVCRNLSSLVAAENTVVSDTLPDELVFISATPAPASGPNPLRWELGTMDPGTTETIYIRVRVDPELTSSVDIINRACISTTTPESRYDNNCSQAPTPVELVYFRARLEPGAVSVEWETAWEIDTYGFYVYRGETRRWSDAEELAFLDATGHGYTSGAKYVYRDESIETRQEYYYWLSAVDTSGRRAIYGPAWSHDISLFTGLTR